jgi:hypothetical protein
MSVESSNAASKASTKIKKKKQNNGFWEQLAVVGEWVCTCHQQAMTSKSNNNDCCSMRWQFLLFRWSMVHPQI